MKNWNIFKSEKVTTVVPERPELSNNGGDYYFGVEVVIVADEKGQQSVFETEWTSAEFPYDEIHGSFDKDAKYVQIENINPPMAVYTRKDRVTVEDLIALTERKYAPRERVDYSAHNPGNRRR